jgi:hypothetical protein
MQKGFYKNYMMVLLEDILEGTPQHTNSQGRILLAYNVQGFPCICLGNVRFVKSQLEGRRNLHSLYNLFQLTIPFNNGV